MWIAKTALELNGLCIFTGKKDNYPGIIVILKAPEV